MSRKFFSISSWILVGYNVLVILWGAVVRASGSGAGCGNHWPLCNGEIIPVPRQIEQAIEFAHRITSTLDGFLVILLVIFAYRIFGKHSVVFRWSLVGLAFIIIEGLLGRLLVVREWVAMDMSAERALVVAIHLANTYLLLAALAVTAWTSQRWERVEWRGNKLANRLLIAGLVGVMVFSAMGAVTALGDTLFPAQSLLSEIPKDFDPASHFLIQLRVIHPLMAILTSVCLFFGLIYLMKRGFGEKVNQQAKWMLAVMFLQILAGGMTILTLAPIYMQIIHLLLADTFWLVFVVLALEIYTKPRVGTETLP